MLAKCFFNRYKDMNDQSLAWSHHQGLTLTDGWGGKWRNSSFLVKPSKFHVTINIFGFGQTIKKCTGRKAQVYLANPPSLLRTAAGSAFPLDTSTRSDHPLWRLAPAPCPDQSLVKQNAANTSDVCCFHDDFTIIYRDYICHNRETYGDTLGLCLPI